MHIFHIHTDVQWNLFFFTYLLEKYFSNKDHKVEEFTFSRFVQQDISL